jgi:RHS repeat-associated protein
MIAKQKTDAKSNAGPQNGGVVAPSISLPKGGGAIRGIGEKFAANPVTGTGSMSVPIATSPGRSGFGPQLSLSYDSGAGNGPFGFGWNLSLPSITRKTDKGLPRYRDSEESDVFMLAGAEDLVPVYRQDADGLWVAAHPGFHRNAGDLWVRDQADRLVVHEDDRVIGSATYHVRRFRPRIEGLFARIERWTNTKDATDVSWRSISKDNITTWYGKTAESRIYDPADPTHIFSWLICQSYDDKGNILTYDYKAEESNGIDASQAHERNRSDATRGVQRYLKGIRYGNRSPFFPNYTPDQPPSPLPTDSEWLFEVVFDYGEGHYQALTTPIDDPQFVSAKLPAPTGAWPVRADPFSSYRAGFEVRTYRLCRRVLMFHHFPNELGTADYLVRSTDFTYNETPIGSFISSITQSGHVWQNDLVVPDKYLKKSLPPLEFQYTAATIDPTVRSVDSESIENLPVGLDGNTYQWVDVDGEGISGILTEQAGGWFYKRNLSPLPVRKNGFEEITARFAPVELVANKPVASLAAGHAQFMDLAGDGQQDVVTFEGPVRGFYERTEDADWEPFRAFRSFPNLDTRDPNLKFIDLDGDGHSDILISENDVFRWHPSLAEDGFGPGEITPQFRDEEKGPKLVFADGTQSIYLADLSGDGLTDLLRLRNGEICYWPNLGHGRFGTKVTMDNSPCFDFPDQFDQKRIRLADIDGSGTTDILYLANNRIDVFRNECGNSWSNPESLTSFPSVDDLSAVQVMDLLGNGTACLVWSSPLPGDARRPMRYIDLMGAQKPHLLVRTVNNLGAETLVTYAPSTKFYLQDKLAGEPWITKLPFPVHVVERVDTIDRISRNRFVTRFAYHHGFFDGFDGDEREFRGFGMVEQWDTEEFAALTDSDVLPEPTNIDSASHVPPVRTKTWFHTGAYLVGERITKQFEHEYYREGDSSLGESGLTDTQLEGMLLSDTTLPAGMTSDEEREACRALKGSILRIETYAEDNKEESDRPYAVSERNYTVKQLQPRGDNKHAVFLAHPRESIDFHYERKLYEIGGQQLADPRVSHSITLNVDDFGNVLRSAAVAYGRRHPDPALQADDQQRQKRTHLTSTENDFTNALDEPDVHRTPLPCESRTYEVLKAIPTANQPQVTNLFRFAELDGIVTTVSDDTHEIPYENWDTDENTLLAPSCRLIEHVRTLYRKNDLTDLLALKTLESLALPGESYKLAFTPELAREIYVDSGKLTQNDLNTVLADEGKYVHSENDANWWIPTGRIFYSAESNDAAADELAYALAHFFVPLRYRNPFHTNAVSTESFVSYDGYNLLVVETRDALGNRVTVGERNIDPTQPMVREGHDYRVLQPALMMDPNRNRSAVAFDALGMVAGTALMGKPEDNPVPGDRLEPTFHADLTQAEIDQFVLNPKGLIAATLLDAATTRIVYDLTRYWREPNPQKEPPAFAAILARETHDSEPVPTGELQIQVSLSYSDGFGREIQKKIQAEPGPVKEGGPEVEPRWVGNGWTIFNNRGKPVRQYEPFFSATHGFEFARIVGVSPILFYDAAERVIATLHANHTYGKVVFDPWRQSTYDVNDTIAPAGTETGDPRTDADIKGYVAEYFKQVTPQPTDWETWLQQRSIDPANPPQDTPGLDLDQKAAVRTLVHANTPTVAYFDTLGRPFLTIAHNKFRRLKPDGTIETIEEKYPTRINLDIEGNQREVRDALEQNNEPQGRVVMRYDYDILSNRIHEISMDAGERWMLNDVTGKPIYVWDQRGHTLENKYDELRRPVSLLVSGAGDIPLNRKVLAETIVYGEPQGDTKNHRGRVYQHYDGAGVFTNIAYDFKGNLAESSRKLVKEYKAQIDWNHPPADDETFSNSTTYDALNRPLTVITPDKSVYRSTFNEANLLKRIDVNLRRAAAATSFVTNIDYNAKGQRQKIEYGNAVVTTYDYDKDTFRLTKLLTTRAASTPLQALSYFYDPIGNITSIQDDAQQTIFFNGQVVEPQSEYTYDATYRLISATGREHIGQLLSPRQRDHDDSFWTELQHPHDGQAMASYLESYQYDPVGNILTMAHRRTDLANPGWTRLYKYEQDPANPSRSKSNRLVQSTPAGPNKGGMTNYIYDVHGNMISMPHLPTLEWDFKDQLHATQQQVVNGGPGEKTFYVYDAAGHRVRKVTVTPNGEIKSERIYLSGFEIYRKYNANGVNPTLERETLHIMDDKQRIALIETRTQGNEPGVAAQLTRYQFGNHLGSASLELDDHAQIISYEEYTPYGSTSYQAVQNQTETPKRYRYSAKERDEESGLYYHEARYYAAWLGRWTATDPMGIADGMNMFCYVSNRPINMKDPSGHAGQSSVLGDLILYYDKVLNSAAVGAKVEKDHAISQAVIKSILGPLESLYKSGRDLTTVVETGAASGSTAARWHTVKSTLEKAVQTTVGALTAEGKAFSLGEKVVEPVANILKTASGASQLSRQQYLATLSQLGNLFATTTPEQAGKLAAIIESGDSAKLAATVDKMATSRTGVAKWMKVLRGIASSENAMAAASKAATFGQKAASLVAKAAPIVKALAPVGRVLGKVAGPLGLGVAAAQFATAKNTEQKADAGITAASAGLMMSKHPVAMAAGAGLAAGQLIDHTLNVSDYSSRAGVAVYEKLKEAGLNDTASFVVGGAASLAAIVPSIGYGAAAKVSSWFK